MASFIVLVLACLSASASAYNNRFIFNGFGKFLCDHYGGKDNVCDSGVTDKEIRSNIPNDCVDLCTTCPEAELWADIESLTNPDPALDLTGLGMQLQGDAADVSDMCDASTGFTVVFTDTFTYTGQLKYARWQFTSKCAANSPGNFGLILGIFRPSGSVPCTYEVVGELEILRSNMDALLSPATSGMVQYDLTALESSMMQFTAGDHFGFRWRGSGAVAYTEKPSGNYICLDKVTPWQSGDTITLATSATRALRLYSMEHGAMPY